MSPAERESRRLTLPQRDLLLALDGAESRDWKALAKNVRTRLAIDHLTVWFKSGALSLYYMRRLTPVGVRLQEWAAKMDDRYVGKMYRPYPVDDSEDLSYCDSHQKQVGGVMATKFSDPEVDAMDISEVTVRRTTPFMRFWSAVNDQLAERGKMVIPYGEAKHRWNLAAEEGWN